MEDDILHNISHWLPGASIADENSALAQAYEYLLARLAWAA